jgi:prepilin signal peptidase PulO-like enzyme (type II secretory pathway)
MVPLVVACTAAAIAAFTDFRRFKVYNVLTLPVLMSGFVYHVAISGGEGATTSALGVTAALAIMLIPYLLGGLGAGDVKFFMALGSWLGAAPLVPIFVVGVAATAVYSLVQGFFAGTLSSLWWNVQVSLLRIASLGRMLAADDCREDYHDWVDHKDRHKRLIPFSAMLALGLVVTLVCFFKVSLR